MRGSGCQIFCTPAVTVTASSHVSGTSVNRDSTGFLFRFGPKRCHFSGMIVVPRQRPIAASIWLAMPNSGQSDLMPPRGSRTP